MIIRAKFLAGIFLLACICLMGGCARSVRYGDPRAVETVTAEFGSTDLQMIAQKMAKSLSDAPALWDKRPVLYVAQVKNKTTEHIDTQNITDSIRTQLLKSGKVRFTAAMEVNQDIVQQLQYQIDSGMVRPDTAKKMGQQIGADYFLYGVITEIHKKAGRVEDTYFKFTLNLVNIETALIDWADEKEIRKVTKRRVFGG